MTILRPGRGGPITWSGLTPRIVSPRCTRPNSGPGCSPRALRGRVERARPLVLEQHVAVRLAAVRDRHGGDPVAVPLEHLARLELADVAARTRRDRATRAIEREQLGQAPGTVDRQRRLAAAQVERFQQPREAEPVVRVEVRDEHLVDVDQPDRPEQLALRALAAVDQDPLAAPADQDRRQAAASGRHRAAGAREEDREIHARSVSVERDELEPERGRRRASRRPSCGPGRGGARSGCRG